MDWKIYASSERGKVARRKAWRKYGERNKEKIKIYARSEKRKIHQKIYNYNRADKL